MQKPDYARISVPALALYAAPRTWMEMMPDAPEFKDPKEADVLREVLSYLARLD